MYRPRVIPCLLLHQQGLVKTRQFSEPTYVGDPVNAVKIFNDAEADELVFLDISARKEGRTPNIEVIKEIGEEAFMPFAVGGGIDSLEQAQMIISAGAEKVVLNTAAIERPALVGEVADKLGNQSVVISLDVRRMEGGDYHVFTYGGTKDTGKGPVQWAERFSTEGAGEVLINSIDRDGTGEGYDIELIQQVSAAVDIPVIACGGASSYDDLPTAIRGGASAAAAGSVFVFIGKKRAVLINYPEQEELVELFAE